MSGSSIRARWPAPGPLLVGLMALVTVWAATACGADTTSTDAVTPSAGAVDAAEASAGAVDAYPDLVLETTAGASLDFNSLEGQDTVLWFWAPW